MNDLATLPDRIALVCEGLASLRIDRPAFLEQCARLVAADIGCARAGMWQLVETPNQRLLRCLAMYDVETDAMVAVPDSHDVGAYFLALARTGYVNACDAGSHFATTGNLARRLSTRRIQSLLAASLAVNGELHGALTCTEVERQVEWSQPQVTALRRVAERVALVLFVGRAKGETPC